MGICESKSNNQVNLTNNTNKNTNIPGMALTNNTNDLNQPKYSNKKEILYPNIGRYEGEVKNGKPEGKGILYINGGDRLEGDFKNGIPEGKGNYY